MNCSMALGNDNRLLEKLYLQKGLVEKLSAENHRRLIDNITKKKFLDPLKERESDIIEFLYIGSAYEGTDIAGNCEYDILIVLDEKKMAVNKVADGIAELSPDGDFRCRYSKLASMSPDDQIKRFISLVTKMKNLLCNDLALSDGLEVKISQKDPAIYMEIVGNSIKVAHKLIPCVKDNTNILFIPAFDNKKPLKWVQCFSVEEKEILKIANSDGGCRKKCLRLLKVMRSEESTLHKLTSYDLKSLLLHECDKPDLQWKNENLAARWQGLLASLIESLEKKLLPHYFIPEINLFHDLGDDIRNHMINRLKRIRNKFLASGMLFEPKPEGVRPTFAESSKTSLLNLLRRFYQHEIPAPRSMAEGQRTLMENVKEKILAYLRECGIVQEFRYTGSAYEGVNLKISSDYDIMIVINGKKRIKVADEIPGFVLLAPFEGQVKFAEFCNKGYLSPRLVASYFFGVITKAKNEILSGSSQELAGLEIVPHQHGPAIDVQIKWGEHELSLDLTPCFIVDDKRRYIAKTFKVGGDLPFSLKGKDPEMLWRQSFSFEEVKLLEKADRDGGCRKMVLRIMKAIRKKETPLKKLSSYHLKTLLMHEMKQSDKDWSKEKLADCWLGFLQTLHDALQKRLIEHNFIEGFNLLNGIKDSTIENMKNYVAKLLRSDKEREKILTLG